MFGCEWYLFVVVDWDVDVVIFVFLEVKVFVFEIMFGVLNWIWEFVFEFWLFLWGGFLLYVIIEKGWFF